MRKNLFICLLLLLAGSILVLGQEKTVKLNGYVVDNACATAHANDEKVVETVKNHPKSCALMPGCVKSGYAILADGKLYKFDEAGNKLVADIYKKTKREKGLPVSVEGTIEGDTLHVKKISEATE